MVLLLLVVCILRLVHDVPRVTHVFSECAREHGRHAHTTLEYF